MEFEGKKILVLGAGSSGVAAARFLRRKGAVVGIYDDSVNVHSVNEAIFVGSREQVEFEKFDKCVISPGVSVNHEVAKMFEGRIMSELDLGFFFKKQAIKKPIVAITGTNGKTTVTKLISRALGERAVACGNVGIPVTSVADKIAKKIAVVEVSSFMLESSVNFSADIGIILNVTQDHLERHGDVREYVRCKAKLATASKLLILNYDDEVVRAMATDNTLFFSMMEPVDGVFLRGKDIVYRVKGKEKVIANLDDFDESKPHAIANILVTALVCRLLRVPMRSVLRAYNEIRSDDNRIQYVAHVDSVAFYNDSKATNIAACLAACKCFVMPINLIVGGQTKNQNFEELFKKLPRTVEHVFCYGSGAEDILEAARQMKYVNVTRCKDLADATISASKHGIGPRIVLLSPACASMDEFQNYQDRGQRFMDIVKGLAEDVGV